MTLAADHYERLLARNYTWMLGGDLAALAVDEAEYLSGLVTAPDGNAGGTAVDLGCGPGPQSLALARLGYTRVLAVDTSAELLAELAGAADGDPVIEPVRADLRTALPRLVAHGEADLIVCMGDTLPHLPAMDDVPALLADCATALAAGGRLVITYRDLTRPRTGTDRFFLVRGTEDRVLSCFLEYDGDVVHVHDVLTTREAGMWTQQVSTYPKLRVAADRLAEQCAKAGLTVERSETGPRGMHLLTAVKRGPAA